MLTSEFVYDLPDAAIAQAAVEPRDSSRLLDTRDLSDHRFAELPALLRRGDLLVVNTTRVRRARLAATKSTGGAVEVLLLNPIGDGAWEALVRPGRRVRQGTRLSAGPATLEVRTAPREGVVVVDVVDGSLEEAVAAIGAVPLPPYFHGSLADPERYQTVYGRRVGSAAAPTAGLHFTEGLLEAVGSAGVEVATIDLEIGLDTFRPIGAARLADHRMHRERAIVSPPLIEAVTAARARGGRIVAVGTTVVRSLEAAAATGELEPMDAPTDLFITPGFRFRVVDLLITNFHVPGSTLVVLVAAFMGPEWRKTYEAALQRGYRFLSFGDAMLAERAS
ncbi:MAG: tRNA preQ1(34) S-adenosylmethionine ribosyltransferase-isomerase QueA [Acidimicrobiia bacterium]|nr:tRNA preQ1(34) S-adenosylmethionine ribosyltransferase-isomerase QueA [Acidimicrobiia bacterium]